MLDVIVSQTKIEIAIEGPAGVTRDGLWQLVQQTATKTVNDLNLENPVTPKVDDAYKRLIWPFIVNEPQLNFFHDTSIDAMQVDQDNDAPSVPKTVPTEATLSEQAVPASDKDTTTPVVKETASQPKKTKSKGATKSAAKRKTKKPAKKKKTARKGGDDSSEDEYQPEDNESSEDDDDDFELEAEENDDEDEENAPEEEDDANAEPSKAGLSIVVDTSNYQPIDDIKNLSFDQVEDMYGSRLRVVADAELQKEQLFVGLPPGKPIPDNQAIVLGIILRSRHKGYTQAALTKEHGLDARSSGHYVKSLAKRGAIIRKPVSAGFRTNLCIHVRFNTTDEQKHKAGASSTSKPMAYNINAFGVAYSNKTLTMAIAKLLDGAPDHVMYTDDILKALAFNPAEKYVRKWFFRCVDEPCSKNIFRKLRPTGQGTSRIIQLIDHSYVERAKGSSTDNAIVQDTSNIDPERKEKGCVGLVLKSRGANGDRIVGMDYDMMLEPQLLDTLYSMGTTGATQKDLAHILGYSDHRALYKGLEKLSSLPKTADSTRFTVQKALEFEGRIKRYRYYTLQAYMQQTQNKSIELTGPPKYTVKDSDLAYFDYRCAENRILSPEQARNLRNTQPAPEVSTVSKKRGRSQKSSQSTEAVSSEAPAMKRSTRSSTTATAESEQSSQSNLASIFLPKKRSLAQTDTENESRDENEQQTTQEENEPPQQKKPRGRPRKNPVPSEEPPQPKRPRGRPRKNPVPAEATVSIQEPTNMPDTQQQPEAAAMDTEESLTTPQDQNTASAEEPVNTSDTQEQRQEPESAMNVDLPVQHDLTPRRAESAMNVDQRIQSPSRHDNTPRRAESPMNVDRSIQSPSRQDITPRRRNLFDYFSPMSRPSSPQSRASRPIEEMTTNPGESFRQRMSEIQSETNKQLHAESSSSTEPMTTEENDNMTHPSPSPAVEPESPQTPSRILSHIEDQPKQRITSRHSDKIFRTKDGIVSAKHTRTSDSTNAYMISRKNVMLDLLNDKGILERGGELKTVFLERYREKYGDIKMARNPDNKTVWRTMESLAQEGHCYITTVDIANYTGKPQSRWVAVRKDLSKDGPEMAAFIQEQEHKRVQIAYRGKMSKFDKFEKTVERLEDRIVRMEDTRDTLLAEESPEARRLRDDIKILRENMAKASQLKEKMQVAKSSGNWFMIAIQYGFIGSKWVRVKLIHQYLFGLLQSGGDGIDQEKRTIRPAAIIMRMKLGLCLQTIGYYWTNNELSEYIQDQSNLEKTLAELPENIKIMIISDKNRFRRRLRTLLDHLLTLKAIDQINDNGERIEDFKETTGNFPPAYRLCHKIPIIDYWTPDRTVIREYVAEMPSDILVYWSDLQYISTSTSNDQRGTPYPESEEELQLIRALATPRNWSSHYVFAREQREVLNSYVTKNTGQTPYNNTQQCKEIAQSLKVPLQMVLNYYQKLQAAFTRKFNKKSARDLEAHISGRRKRRRRRGAEMEHSAHRAISINTKKVFRRHATYSTARQLLDEQESAAASSSTDQHNDAYLNDEKSIPLVDENINVYNLKRRRIRRIQWKVEEDELLLYCYVIMKSRAQRLQSRFMWKSMEVVLPERPPEQCRHRLGRLKMIPKIAEHIVHLTSLWTIYYNQGIRNGAIKDENPYDSINFNLLEYLEYFIQRIQSYATDGLEVNIDLPSSRQQLESDYDIYVPVGETQSSLKRFEDAFHKVQALVQKQEILTSHWLTIRTPWDHLHDTLPDKAISDEEIDLEFVMIFNRMILFTPSETYDPFFAYSVISQFSDDIRTRAIETMRSDSQLTLAKGARVGDRRLPGTHFGISERYITRMAYTLPENMYEQAKVFERYMMMQHSVKYTPQLVSSGMMACILNLISCSKLKLELLFEDIFNLKAKIPLYRSRLIDERLTNLNVQLMVTAPPKDHGPQELEPMPKDDSQLRKLDDLEFRDHWTCLLQSQEPSVQGELKDIMAILENAGDKGATPHQIKDELLRSGALASDKEIHDYLDMMCNALPPLVAKVGFRSYRYVLTCYLDHWMVVPRKITSTISANSDDAAAHVTQLASTRKATIHPRVWYDINGSLTSAILQGIVESVIQCVLERPGINERDICRRFHKLLVYVEVKDVLDMLVDRGALRKQIIVHTSPKPSLFSKRRIYTSSPDPYVIDRTSQTCYWTTSDYYKHYSITS